MSSPSPANQADQPLARVSHYVEVLTRLTTLGLVLTYVAGFLVVNIHHAQFGIAELDVLKVRVLAAGVLFLFLIALPVIIVTRLFGIFGMDALRAIPIAHRPENRSLQQFTLVMAMYIACLALALGVGPLFVEHGVWPNAPLATASLCIGVVLAPVVGRFFAHHPKKCTALTSASIVGIAWTTAVGFGMPLFLRSLWFYGCALGTFSIYKIASKPGYLKRFEFERFIGVPLALLIGFSIWVYGTVNSQFGGGAPVSVRIYVTADAMKIIGGEVANAWLVDQTDYGFYILRSRDQKKSMLIPRPLVRGIEFTNEPQPGENSKK